MHLELMRDKARDFPQVDSPQGYASARVWHCGYRTLAPLTRFSNLRTLEIATYPDETLEPLGRLVALEELRILHLPHVTDLAPLTNLRQLRLLSLETLPSWDASGKTTGVLSLKPLAELPHLEEINLFGVRPVSKRVDDLLLSLSLRRARLSKYPKAEIDRLQKVLAER
jgi:hypothetical protein